MLSSLVVVAGSTRAHAQPHVRFDVRGSCPDEREIVRAFGGRVLAAPATDSAAWSVEIDSTGPAATFVLRAPDGQVAAGRTIASRDCTALGEAFAFIVLAHFAELELLPEARAAPAAPVEASRAVQPPPSSRAQVTQHALELGVAAGAGAALWLAPSALSPVAALALALGPPQRGWLARFGVQLAAPVRHDGATDRIERWTTDLRLELGGRARLDSALWFAATAGGGIALVRLTALDLEGQPKTLRTWPAASLSALLGLELSRRWSLRVGAEAALYLRADRYRIAPEGVVARSPRAAISATVGLQFDTPL